MKKNNHPIQPIHSISTTWSQWGKAAFAFTVATGAYALTKAVGLLAGSTPQTQAQPPLNLQTSIITSPVAAPAMQYPNFTPETTQSWSPHSNTDTHIPLFITLSTLTLTAPRYPLISLSALGLSLFQFLPCAQAIFPATLDLATLTASEGFTLQGAAAGDVTGFSVSAAGDVNGDGLTDMLVGAFFADPLGRTEAGVAYLLFGRSGSWPAAIDLANLNASLGVVLQGAAAGDRTGFSVSAVGDVNGDGLTDMLVGSYRANPLGRNYAGVAYVIYGQGASLPSPTLPQTSNTSPSPTSLIPTPSPSAVLVSSATTAAPLTSAGLSADSSSSTAVSQTSVNNPFTLSQRITDTTALSSPAIFTATPNSSVSATSATTAALPTGIGTATTQQGTASEVSAAASSTTLTISQTTGNSPTGDSNAINPSQSTVDTITPSSQAAPSTQASQATTGVLTQNNPGFSIYSTSVLYLTIGIDTIITTDNLSVEGFTGDPKQLIFSIPENSAYTMTVNGVEQYSFPLWAIQQGFVRLTLGDEFCFEDFNEIPVQATDGRSMADSNLEFQGDAASCIFNDASKLNARSSLQGMAMLLMSSGLGFLASRQRDKSTVKNATTDCQKNKNEDGVFDPLIGLYVSN